MLDSRHVYNLLRRGFDGNLPPVLCGLFFPGADGIVRRFAQQAPAVHRERMVQLVSRRTVLQTAVLFSLVSARPRNVQALVDGDDDVKKALEINAAEQAKRAAALEEVRAGFFWRIQCDVDEFVSRGMHLIPLLWTLKSS